MFQKKHSLAYRMTLRVILFSSLIAICFTILQLYLDFRQDVRNIHSFFASIRETSLRPLEESVWILDDLQISLQLEGLIKREDIVYAAVAMNGEVIWAEGTPVRTNAISQNYPLVRTIRGGQEEIGRLVVAASLDGVYRRMLRRVVILLVTNTFKTFLVSGFILLLFRKNITRHLERFAEYVQQIDIQHQEPKPLTLERGPTPVDELDQMTTALNALCQSGYQVYRDLSTQEQRLRLFLNATESAIFGVDQKGDCTFINQIACEYLGVTEEQGVLGHNLLERIGRDEARRSMMDVFVEQVLSTISQCRPRFVDEMPLILPDDSVISISQRSYPVIEQGGCTGAIVFFTDISRQQKLEQEKQLFSKIVRQAPSLILIADAQGTVEFVNRGFEQVMGTGADALVGMKVLDYLANLDLAPRMDQVREKIHRGETWSGTISQTNPSGRGIILDAAIFPIHDGKGMLTNVVAMGKDITREQQLVDQLHHVQKMEAMGKLAASIAHEFGNPLLGIRFALRDLQQRPELTAKDVDLLLLAEQECDRMRKLIRDLQQFNRPSSGRKTEFDLHRILEDILALHHNLLCKKRVRVVRAYAAHPVRLQAVEDQIRQVLINLIINATDAMSAGGGILTLSTQVCNDELVLLVRDSGSGIAQEHLDKIFEPFFTTKSAVEGTGLGLPVSYGIIRAHGGRIEVDSEPGCTVFTVVLPLIQNDAMEYAA
jgi:PAS domain S-box-containing protein